MDTVRTLATDLIADAGWAGAIAGTVDAILRADTWRQRRRGLAVLWAIVTA